MNFMAHLTSLRAKCTQGVKLISDQAARVPSQYIPQGVIKTDGILKFNAVFAAYGICNVNLKAAIRFINPFRILARDMPFLRRERPLNRKIALLAKMAATHYSAHSQSPLAFR